MTKEVLAIIPAKADSKRLKNKNVSLLAGKPLIVHTIIAALGSKMITRVVVSTDSKKIEKIAGMFGAEVPFLRPKSLAKGNILTVDVLRHALNWLERRENYKPDAVVLLEPTYPIREEGMIDRAIKKFFNEKLDSVFAVAEEREYHWKKKGNLFQKQFKEYSFIKESLYIDGAVYVIKPGLVKKRKRIGQKNGAIVVSPLCIKTDVHNKFDLWVAEKIINGWLKKRGNKL